MKKNDHDKDNLNGNKDKDADLKCEIDKISNPIPSWLNVFFKSYTISCSADINEGIIKGYPIDDDFQALFINNIIDGSKKYSLKIPAL